MEPIYGFIPFGKVDKGGEVQVFVVPYHIASGRLVCRMIRNEGAVPAEMLRGDGIDSAQTKVVDKVHAGLWYKHKVFSVVKADGGVALPQGALESLEKHLKLRSEVTGESRLLFHGPLPEKNESRRSSTEEDEEALWRLHHPNAAPRQSGVQQQPSTVQATVQYRNMTESEAAKALRKQYEEGLAALDAAEKAASDRISMLEEFYARHLAEVKAAEEAAAIKAAEEAAILAKKAAEEEAELARLAEEEAKADKEAAAAWRAFQKAAATDPKLAAAAAKIASTVTTKTGEQQEG